MLIIFSLGRVSLPASTSHGPIRGTSGQPPAELHSLSRSDPNPCVVLPTPNPCVFLQANPCLCTNPPPECPLQEMPHPDLPSSGVVLQSNRGTGMCLPVLTTVTVWTSHPAPPPPSLLSPPPRFLLHPNTLKSLDTDQRQTGNVRICF